MKKGLGVFLAVLLMGQTVVSAQQPLGITRVLLYKNGMAYVVRSGQITAPVSLTFHPEDMNDILKSFTAWNPDTGSLYSVGYTAGIPSSHMLSRFPFDISGPDTGLGGFLIQVKGADLKLDHSGRDLQGKLVAVQATDRATAPQTTSSDHRLTVLLRDGSLQTVWLSDVRSIEFVDPQLRDQLRSYLEVLAAGRQDVTREVSVYPVPAPGPIQVAYLQQFPLWKTSYRIDLGAKESKIQGWAQIDNPTGEAWENVTVSLLSGAPVSFKMNLYDPLYTNRTTLPVPGGQVAAPRQYESAVSKSEETPAQAARQASLADTFEMELSNRAPAAAGGRGGGGGRGPVAAAPPPPPPALAPSAVLFQQADSARVEDFYEYKFPFPVRIASRQSALLPFLQKTMNVERLSIFNARTDRSNPRLGARLENNTDIPFEAGPVTFFQETRYAGEAVLDYLPRGEKALISYGIDNEIQISSRAQTQPENTVRLTVSKGVAVLFMESVLTTTYEIRNKGMDRKTLIVEHPRLNNRTLKGIDAFETTESFHRFRVSLSAGQQTTLPVPEVVARQTTISLTTLTRPQLTLFAGKETPQSVREKLGQIVDTQEQIATMRSQVQSTQSGVDTLFRDQERLRENLKSLRDGNEDQQLRTRYLDQLRRQEDQIDASRARIESINKEIAATQSKLSDLISNLTFGN
ncbi:MAG TPA: hypothetical protein VFR18_25315 [Terriglobia bacterium]|nr:hypothetical protein [Terriglobia bacterium]